MKITREVYNNIKDVYAQKSKTIKTKKGRYGAVAKWTGLSKSTVGKVVRSKSYKEYRKMREEETQKRVKVRKPKPSSKKVKVNKVPKKQGAEETIGGLVKDKDEAVANFIKADKKNKMLTKKIENYEGVLDERAEAILGLQKQLDQASDENNELRHELDQSTNVVCRFNRSSFFKRLFTTRLEH